MSTPAETIADLRHIAKIHAGRTRHECITEAADWLEFYITEVERLLVLTKQAADIIERLESGRQA